jgi:hypothetical protein
MQSIRWTFARQPGACFLLAGVLLLLVSSVASAAEPLAGSPWIHRLDPLGGARGSIQPLTIVGERLSNTTRVEFISPALSWIETSEASWGKITGKVGIAADAPLGPHIFRLVSADGRSNSRLFYVDSFASLTEAEPNDRLPAAQSIELRAQVIHGDMHELADVDTYAFEARAGERWTFDLHSIEYGGFFEGNMTLLDAAGRQIAFNDDRDDYLETPFLEHVFAESGRHYLKLDQYRGPQRVDCFKNCGYMLRLSQLPVVEAAFPLGAPAGADTRVAIRGRALESIEKVFLQQARGGEYYRLTFPYTLPLRIGSDADEKSPARIEGEIVSSASTQAEIRFSIPKDAPAGIWRLWTAGPHGVSDDLSFEISHLRELSEADARKDDWRGGEVVVNASLDKDAEEDSFWLQARAQEPLNIATLAAQLGLPSIDTVLELFDETGRVLAEHDDLMSGQGTVIGNPDSSLVYVPEKDQRLRLVVRDRLGRGGPSFVYRLKIANRAAGFSLLADPENVNVARGGEAELGVLLIREPGFEGDVEVWVESLPGGASAAPGRFRADQFFGPSADGDNIIIPELALKIKVPASLPPGDYPVRVFGRAASGDRVVEAFTTLWIGPARKRNDVRRPLPRILLTVVEPAQAELSTVEDSLQLLSGGNTTLTLKTAGLSSEAEFRLAGIPAGLQYRILERRAEQVLIEIQAAESATGGEAELVVEAGAAGRWTASQPIRLTITPDPRERAGR